ncbi:MAG TPA: c-type cytochrome biogenesis protein CcsB [Candidatus Desulfofervidus auxilii]|uniref:C-type cytochrome biogenesis protein CcsB n=1 Tax=Desulfofervidus auxilii TaxID=1621989 RepID=A0A7C0U1I5_DESA2|nr:c-type cytochrome biogenesis protein CcsB [Candidatus Desulfofervidus auxilii]
MDNFFYQMSLFGYTVSMICFLINLFTIHRTLLRIATFILFFTFWLHTAAIGFSWMRYGFFPLLSMGGSLSFVAWSLSLIYLILFYRFNVGILGAFFTPLIVSLLFLSRLVPGIATPPRPSFRELWLTLHIGLSLIGDALLAVAFCAGIVYLLQESQIKQKKTRGIFRRLPALSFLDTLNYHALIVGFVMLTLGLVSGSIYAQWVRGQFFSWDPKEIWSVLTWLVYAVLLYQRITKGMRGRRAAWLSIIGFACLLFTFLGVNYLLKGYHSFR